VALFIKTRIHFSAKAIKTGRGQKKEGRRRQKEKGRGRQEKEGRRG
jgi:hypothetical protein